MSPGSVDGPVANGASTMSPGSVDGPVSPEEERDPVMVAGFGTLHHSNLDLALAQLGMTLEEAESALGTNDKWSFPGYACGWRQHHDAIRFALDRLVEAAARTKEVVASGQPLALWQVSGLQLLVKDFCDFADAHSEHEEEIFYRWMKRRVELPVCLTADHGDIERLLTRIEVRVKLLRPGPAPDKLESVAKLHSRLVSLRELMLPHMELEEFVSLVLLRTHFTEKEAKTPERREKRRLTRHDLAFVGRSMNTANKKTMLQRLGASRLFTKLVLLPAMLRDDATVGLAFRELTTGRPTPASLEAEAAFEESGAARGQQDGARGLREQGQRERGREKEGPGGREGGGGGEGGGEGGGKEGGEGPDEGKELRPDLRGPAGYYALKHRQARDPACGGPNRAWDSTAEVCCRCFGGCMNACGA
ncbi:hypothetical protein HYH03_007318 [Edaphochlamys debaryana]|uniref:Hemerythrin-like domain-containing protein n=1 Tax=Edaphochlamys debaryana TaxID=47281 RepID=A0A835Y261_9CHLO|nr:hypothetical protein HYH03_007318 [Edaphochlamys debaryana]|eukprot:KAG2494551.1 hypothetical protein HYH03_007318 [Edaphochlamys debaryana]